ncbi:ComF family protein [Lactococcus petauri]|uniref:ComF family protein n=1 Tax=Lactococcus petauri TaxID=1940789 RepID=UPI00177ADB57|nr:ComF family protein [Lactococcus petauri]MBD5824284.1 ComF family protein [Lactococcus petauri]
MICLLCHTEYTIEATFHQLFLLKDSSPGLCTTCDNKFQLITPPYCSRCYKPDIKDVCSDCKIWEKEGIIVNHQAVFTYNTAMEEFFSRYKFLGDYRLHHVFHKYFQIEKGHTIVPIPVSKQRFQERGFNQVAALLQQLPFSSLLEKEEGPAQNTRTRNERLKNKNTFTLKAKVKVPDKILLVDDVYTTGRTLQHAIAVLKQGGAQEIKTFSLCR